MRILNLLSSIAPVLVCLAAPVEGGGGGTPNDEFPLGADSQAPEIVGATIEEQRTNALSALGKLFKQAQGLFAKVSSLTSDLGSLTSDRDRVQGLYDTAVIENTRLTGDVTRLTGELSTATTSLATEKQHVKNLESHCGVLGIDAKEAIKAPKENKDPATSPVKEQYAALRKQEQSGDVPRGTSSKFYRKHKKDLDAE
jgi:hypothetical protein